MPDQIKFMEMLGDLKEFAIAKGGTITKQEIFDYFKEMDFNEVQYEPIFAYLMEHQIQIEGVEKTEGIESTISDKDEATASSSDSAYLKLYVKEMKSLAKCSKEEEQTLLANVQIGDASCKEDLIHVWLPKVLRIARKYADRGAALEDLVQEGNIGLLAAIEQLNALEEGQDAASYLKENIKQAIVFFLDENQKEEAVETTVIGKSSLIEEASRYLAEELGRVATLEELSDYTRLSVDEIKDIRMLSLDSIKVGKGE